MLVKRVIRIERDKGKTGKGYLHVWAPQYRCFDVEDIISVTRHKPAANILT